MLRNHSTSARIIIAAAIVAWSMPTTLLFAQSLSNPRDARGAVSCQRAITVAGARFAVRKLQHLDKCSRRMLTCIQANAGDCAARSDAACQRDLGKIAADRAKLTGDVLLKCGALGIENLLSDNGLGYANVADDCGAMGVELDTVDDVAQCVRQQHDCTTESLFVAENPRAGEMMRLAGTSAAFECLTDHGGNGESVTGPGMGKEITRCLKGVHQAALHFARTKMKDVGLCLRALFACVQSGQSASACGASSAPTCDRAFAAVAQDVLHLPARVVRSCQRIAYSTLSAPDGANLSALAAECATFGVPDTASLEQYAQCVMQQHECRIEDLLRLESPRAEELLAAAGRAARSSFCPTPTPAPTPTVTATLPLPPTPTVTIPPPLPTLTLPLPTATDTATPLDTGTPTATQTPVPTATLTLPLPTLPLPTLTIPPPLPTLALPTSTATETATATATPPATETPTGTPTPVATATLALPLPTLPLPSLPLPTLPLPLPTLTIPIAIPTP